METLVSYLVALPSGAPHFCTSVRQSFHRLVFGLWHVAEHILFAMQLSVWLMTGHAGGDCYVMAMVMRMGMRRSVMVIDASSEERRWIG